MIIVEKEIKIRSRLTSPQLFAVTWLHIMQYVPTYTDVCVDFIFYQGRYHKWCKANNFLSMLPEDSKARRDAAAEKLKQSQVDDHFTVIPEEEKPTPYTDELFKEAAIQWLIETDQVPFYCLFETHP